MSVRRAAGPDSGSSRIRAAAPPEDQGELIKDEAKQIESDRATGLLIMVDGVPDGAPQMMPTRPVLLMQRDDGGVCFG